jgi:hypothetical protein
LVGLVVAQKYSIQQQQTTYEQRKGKQTKTSSLTSGNGFLMVFSSFLSVKVFNNNDNRIKFLCHHVNAIK